MRILLRTLGAAGLAICVSGCGLLSPTKVVVVDRQSDVVRLGSDVKGTVYTQAPDGSWTKKGKVLLPEGWYAGPGPTE